MLACVTIAVLSKFHQRILLHRRVRPVGATRRMLPDDFSSQHHPYDCMSKEEGDEYYRKQQQDKTEEATSLSEKNSREKTMG